MADVNVEKGSYSVFERLLFFLTPILFTAALLGMLLLLFNEDWRNKALEVGNRVPVLKAVLPEPATTGPGHLTEEELTVSNAKAKIEQLQALLAERETSLQEASRLNETQQAEIARLQAQVEQLTKAQAEQSISAEEYTARIKSLSNVYARMTPGRAAPILENMTIEEAALILASMTDTERTRVMEKMTPKTAAEISLKLKDSDSVQDQQIAALQSRVKELEALAGADVARLDVQQLKNTFSSMPAADAAKLLLELSDGNQSKALLVLGALDDAVRSQVLASMANADQAKAAELVSRLMPSAS